LINETKLNLFKGDNKISFSTNKSVIFTYSYYDYIDKKYFKNNEEYKQERQKSENLTIDKVSDDNNDKNKIKIKFKPNYRYSSTRYIMIVAKENSENTLDNFKDPCYITNLLNQRPKGVKIDVIYDVGENEEIEAEMDIKDISDENNSYLINIISQELRFDKQIKFYQPFKFIHNIEKPPEDENDGGLKGSSLALAIILPIVGVIIIILIVIIIIKRKANKNSEAIENLVK
jgi:hypothetical protein